MAFLNMIGGGFLVMAGWQGIQQAMVVRPAGIVGLFLLCLAAWDGWHGLRLNCKKVDDEA